MKLQKFVAADMREALDEVKRKLGPSAMIVSTKPVRRGLLGSGVEVTAAIDAADAGSDEPSTNNGPRNQTGGGLSETDLERILAPMRSEMRTLRTYLKPFAAARPDDSIQKELAALRALISDRAHGQPLDELAARPGLTAPSHGRIVAIVGPTGVGKTTTVAKLAARAALIENRSVAILTLDSYRVGGEEQIRCFADLIGVPLTLVADPGALAAQLARLAHIDRIYIDTAGRSPRDGGALRALDQAFAGIDGLEVHLAVPAASSPETLDMVARRFAGLGPKRLLFTKCDEAITPTELIRAPHRLGLPISYLTIGQRVPEDIEDASAETLLRLATTAGVFEEAA